MAAVKARLRLELERHLGILGTLGNNAPFIGLFGTVLGIIKAFADLAQQPGRRGAAAVMAGISEALVATAVGLLVAIPAVVAFNIFQGRVRRTMAARRRHGSPDPVGGRRRRRPSRPPPGRGVQSHGRRGQPASAATTRAGG